MKSSPCHERRRVPTEILRTHHQSDDGTLEPASLIEPQCAAVEEGPTGSRNRDAPDAGRRFAMARVARQALNTALCSSVDGRNVAPERAQAHQRGPAMTACNVANNKKPAGTR